MEIMHWIKLLFQYTMFMILLKLVPWAQAAYVAGTGSCQHYNKHFTQDLSDNQMTIFLERNSCEIESTVDSFPQCFTHCNHLGPCTAFTHIGADCHICRDDVTPSTPPSDERVRQRLLIWTDAADSICQRVQNTKPGNITSPNYPDNYDDNTNLCWRISQTNPFADFTRLSLFDLNIEGGHDFLSITSDSEIWTGSGTHRDDDVFPLQTENEYMIEFTTDVSVTREGFVLYYQPGSYECGTSIDSCSGDIQSPNYPNPYPSNTVCSWIIKCPDAIMQLTITSLDLGSSDILYIATGGRTELEVTGSDQSQYDVIQATSAYITFISDGIDEHNAGFRIGFSVMQCDNLNDDDPGRIMSPRSVVGVTDNTAFKCWNILQPNYHADFILITLYKLETEENGDELTISNSNGEHFATLSTSVGDDDIFPLRSDSGFTLEYVRGESSLGTGFSLYYQPASYDCGSNTFINASIPGSVYSPNYPNPYFHDATCSWAIKADPGYDVVLTLNHFDIEASWDFLLMSDGQCGLTIPNPLPSYYVLPRANIVFITFTTDVAISRSGFDIQYRQEPQLEALISGPTHYVDDVAITSSGFHSDPLSHTQSRFNALRSWSVVDIRSGEWVQVEFAEPMAVHRIKTQGRGDYPSQRITSFNLSYKATLSSAEETIQSVDGSPFVFPGNEIEDTCVTNEFPNVIEAQVVKFIIVTWNGHPGMRWELYGNSIVVESGGAGGMGGAGGGNMNSG